MVSPFVVAFHSLQSNSFLTCYALVSSQHLLLSGNLYITASHPPPKAVKSWAVSKFTIPQDGSSSSSGDESEIMSNGFFTVGVPKSLYADTTALPDSNAFGITKYLGMIDMEQFGDARKIVAL